MKIIFFILFIISNHSYAYNGHSLAGMFSVSGALKSFLLKGSMPLGSYSSFYGYEVFNFPNSTPVYCYGGVGLSTQTSLIGVSFGGNAARSSTVGQCKNPQDYTGGFLSLSIGYDGGSGSKDMGIQAGFNIGFDLETFNQKIIDYFHESYDPRGIRKRVKDSINHLISYAGRSSSGKLGKHQLWLKLLSLPLLTSMGADWKKGLDKLKFTMGEMKTLEKRQSMFALKGDIQDLFRAIRNDPDFYICSSKQKDCSEIYVDTYILLEAIEEAMLTCHSVSVAANVASTYDIKIPFISNKLSFSFSYSYYGLRKELNKGVNTSLETLKAYNTHLFWKTNASCMDVEEKAGKSFGKFLAIMGVGEK